MEMPGRVSNSGSYRYAYNGMETDNEISGNGNSYTTEFRQYDPRLGRWKSLDPLMAKFPWQSPYVAFDDNPIKFKDPQGLASQGGGDEPKTHSLKKGETLSHLSKKYGVSVEDLQTWNPGTKGRETKLQIGEKIIVADPKQKQMTQEEKQLERKQKFEESQTFPLPEESSNPSHRMEPHLKRNCDENLDFYMHGDSYDELCHASIVGAQYFVIEGNLLNALKKAPLHHIDDPDNVDFTTKIVNEFKNSGEKYLTGQETVTFGSTNKAVAAFTSATWIMRNCQVKYWVTYGEDNKINVFYIFWDYFNVTPQDDKDGLYNTIGKGLNPLHKASGANINMQTRASWFFTIQQ